MQKKSQIYSSVPVDNRYRKTIRTVHSCKSWFLPSIASKIEATLNGKNWLQEELLLRKEFAPRGSKFFPLRVAPILEAIILSFKSSPYGKEAK